MLWDTESGNSGIWRVGQEQWSVPPTEPMISIEEKNGKLVSLTIGTQMYDSELMPVEEDPGRVRRMPWRTEGCFGTETTDMKIIFLRSRKNSGCAPSVFIC